jgi:hypothetical protein
MKHYKFACHYKDRSVITPDYVYSEAELESSMRRAFACNSELIAIVVTEYTARYYGSFFRGEL